jgi:hypothetical protein
MREVSCSSVGRLMVGAQPRDVATDATSGPPGIPKGFPMRIPLKRAVPLAAGTALLAAIGFGATLPAQASGNAPDDNPTARNGETVEDNGGTRAPGVSDDATPTPTPTPSESSSPRPTPTDIPAPVPLNRTPDATTAPDIVPVEPAPADPAPAPVAPAPAPAPVAPAPVIDDHGGDRAPGGSDDATDGDGGHHRHGGEAGDDSGHHSGDDDSADDSGHHSGGDDSGSDDSGHDANDDHGGRSGGHSSDD